MDCYVICVYVICVCRIVTTPWLDFRGLLLRGGKGIEREGGGGRSKGERKEEGRGASS